MFRDLHITHFRGFREFHMEGLGRINLLVGPNNCGKTTVLEALDLLADYPDPVGLGLTAWHRGGLVAADGANQANLRVAMRHLFFGRSAKAGTHFVLRAQEASGNCALNVSLAPLTASDAEKSSKASAVVGRQALSYTKQTGDETVSHMIPLTPNAEWLWADWNQRYAQVHESLRPNFISPRSIGAQIMADYLAQVTLNPEEDMVLQVLRILEPRIRGIAAVALPSAGLVADRSGVFLKLEGESERVPAASLGEGIWRLLDLALTLVRNRGRTVFIDEIDIGLHYTAQVDMWRMVKQAAEQLDVQVFATTHSSDCIRALASLARKDVTTGSDITIQRIEGERAVAYSERDIVLAAERGIEVR